MRLWLKDSERRPDPEPVNTDDRRALLAGTALWLVALVVVLAAPALTADGRGWFVWTCIVGLGLGLLGLLYAQLTRR